MMRNKVALYIRVSTQEQAEYGFSIEAQKQQLFEHCRDNDLVVHDVYIDAGMSGASTKRRDSFNQMMNDVGKGYFGEIIVWKINRLARNLIDILCMMDVLKKYGVKLKSLSEKFDSSTPIGNFTLQMLGAVSQLERQTILENLELGRKQRGRKGEYCGARILGYDVISKSVCLEQGKESNLEINEPEASVVKQIFQWYANGMGSKNIVSQLNQNGISTKYNKPFSIGTIHKILRNVVYIGQVRFQEDNQEWIVKGKHLPIISHDLWKIVQSRMEKQSKQRNKNHIKQRVYPLTSLLNCPNCGQPMVGTGNTSKNKQGNERIYRYYSCSKRINKGVDTCSFLPVHAGRLEQQVCHIIQIVVNQPSIIDCVYERLNQSKDALEEQELRLKVLSEQERELDIKKGKLFNRFEEEQIPVKVFKTNMSVIKQEVERIIKEKNQIETLLQSNRKSSISKENLFKIFSSLHQLLLMASNEERRTLLSSVIHKISLNKQQKLSHIQIKWKENEEIQDKTILIETKYIKNEEE